MKTILGALALLACAAFFREAKAQTGAWEYQLIETVCLIWAGFRLGAGSRPGETR